MGSIKNIVSICMGVVLLALCIIAILCSLSISVKCFVIFASVYGFFELHRWRKGKPE